MSVFDNLILPFFRKTKNTNIAQSIADIAIKKNILYTILSCFHLCKCVSISCKCTLTLVFIKPLLSGSHFNTVQAKCRTSLQSSYSFCKGLLRRKKAPPKVLHFCPTFGVYFIHGAAIPVAAKSARQDKHRLQKQPTKCVHAICKFSLKYAKRMLLHRLKCNVQSSIFIILYPMPT